MNDGILLKDDLIEENQFHFSLFLSLHYNKENIFK